ncbi:MAG: (Fe-S)-binding protein [Bacillota bacterium]
MDLSPELRRQIALCSRCGTCRAHCPVFGELLEERAVARGKVQAVAALGRRELAATKEIREFFDLCLLCETCEAGCPNGVEVHSLVQAAREEMARARGVGIGGLVLGVLASARRLEAAARLLRFYQWTGAQALARRSGLLRALPGQVGPREDLVPPVELPTLARRYPGVIRPAGRPRFRVAYFTGCMSQAVMTGTGTAVIEMLLLCRAEVVLPPQACCALAIWASGQSRSARRMAEAHIGNFLATGADAIITGCGSCGHMLQRYGELCNTQKAGEFSSKVVDVSAFLYQAGLPEPDVPVSLCITFHDSCHLRRGMGVWEEPRRLLHRIPGLVLAEMDEPDRCCGGGGAFVITHYEVARRIGRRKAKAIQATGAQAVVTGCPGCRVQLSHALRIHQHPLPVYHPVDLLARSYQQQG